MLGESCQDIRQRISFACFTRLLIHCVVESSKFERLLQVEQVVQENPILAIRYAVCFSLAQRHPALGAYHSPG